MLKVQQGDRYGSLTLVKRVDNISGHQAWEATCDCGNTTTARLQNIVKGKTVSCGCVGLSRLTGKLGVPDVASLPDPDDPAYPSDPDAFKNIAKTEGELLAKIQPHRTAWLAGYDRKQHAARMDEAWAILRRCAARTASPQDLAQKDAADRAILDTLDLNPDPALLRDHADLLYLIKRGPDHDTD